MLIRFLLAITPSCYSMNKVLDGIHVIVRLTLTTTIIGAALCAGCERATEPGAENESAAVNDVVSLPIELPPGDPRNEALQAIRYPNHGEAKELGMAKFGGAMVNVTQYGPILEGGEGHFLIDTGRTKVDGVYVWIGLEEDGKKRRWPATPEPSGFHVHCAVPRPLKDDHVLWVEIRLPSGDRDRGQFYIGER